MHDPHTGPVTHLSATYDDHYVISAGADGNVFVYSASLPTAISEDTPLPHELEVYIDTTSPTHDVCSLPPSA